MSSNKQNTALEVCFEPQLQRVVLIFLNLILVTLMILYKALSFKQKLKTINLADFTSDHSHTHRCAFKFSPLWELCKNAKCMLRLAKLLRFFCKFSTHNRFHFFPLITLSTRWQKWLVHYLTFEKERDGNNNKCLHWWAFVSDEIHVHVLIITKTCLMVIRFLERNNMCIGC